MVKYENATLGSYLNATTAHFDINEIGTLTWLLCAETHKKTEDP